MWTPQLERQAGGAFHGGKVTGVSAASDVGGGDVFHQRRFMLGVFEFAHVAIEIDFHNEYSHRSCCCNNSNARSISTRSNCASSRGRN